MWFLSPSHASLLEHSLQQSAIVFVHYAMSDMSVWFCFFLSPSVYSPSLLGLFSFSHRCKFFSLTETPENYTVVLDEEGFKGKTHTHTPVLNCCPQALLCSFNNDTNFMEYTGKYIILFIVMLSPYTIVPGDL